MPTASRNSGTEITGRIVRGSNRSRMCPDALPPAAAAHLSCAPRRPRPAPTADPDRSAPPRYARPHGLQHGRTVAKAVPGPGTPRAAIAHRGTSRTGGTDGYRPADFRGRRARAPAGADVVASADRSGSYGRARPGDRSTLIGRRRPGRGLRTSGRVALLPAAASRRKTKCLDTSPAQRARPRRRPTVTGTPPTRPNRQAQATDRTHRRARTPRSTEGGTKENKRRKANKERARSRPAPATEQAARRHPRHLTRDPPKRRAAATG